MTLQKWRWRRAETGGRENIWRRPLITLHSHMSVGLMRLTECKREELMRVCVCVCVFEGCVCFCEGAGCEGEAWRRTQKEWNIAVLEDLFDSQSSHTNIKHLLIIKATLRLHTNAIYRRDHRPRRDNCLQEWFLRCSSFIKRLLMRTPVFSRTVTRGANAIRAEWHRVPRWRGWTDVGAAHPRCLTSDERPAFAPVHQQQQLRRRQHTLPQVWNTHTHTRAQTEALTFNSHKLQEHLHTHLCTQESCLSPRAHSKRSQPQPPRHSPAATRIRTAAAPLVILPFKFPPPPIPLPTSIRFHSALSSSRQSAQYSTETVSRIPGGFGGPVSVGERRASSADHKSGAQFLLRPVSGTHTHAS